MHVLQPGLVATRRRVPVRSAHDLGPVGGQALEVLRMLVRMRERVVELRVLQAPRVMSSGQREKSRLAAGELEQ